jgi:hypothetical protein
MNERIFELAEQAYEETHRVMGSTCLQEAFDDFYTEKFAELIVRDCYVALFPALRDMISRGQAYDLIKQHFGVE